MIKKYYKIIYYIFATLSIQSLLAELTQQEEAFLSAVHRKDVKLVQIALSAEVDPNVSDISQFPRTRALDIALQQKNMKMIELLLTFGADPNLLEDASIAVIARKVVIDNNFDLLDLFLYHNFDINRKAQPCFVRRSSHFSPPMIVDHSRNQGSALLTQALLAAQREFQCYPVPYAKIKKFLGGIEYILKQGASFNDLSNKEIYGDMMPSNRKGYFDFCLLLMSYGAPKPIMNQHEAFLWPDTEDGLQFLLHDIELQDHENHLNWIFSTSKAWWDSYPQSLYEMLYKLIITLKFGAIRDRLKEYQEQRPAIDDGEYLSNLINNLKVSLAKKDWEDSTHAFVNVEKFDPTFSHAAQSKKLKALMPKLIAQSAIPLTDEHIADLMLIANNYYLMHNSLLALSDRAVSNFSKTKPRGNIRAPRTTTTTTTITTASCATHNPKRSREDEDGNEGQGNPKRPRTEAAAATLSLDPNVPRLEE